MQSAHTMANVAMVVTNACDPDPRVINSAKWLVEVGHQVTIHAYDRLHISQKETSVEGVGILRYRLGITPYGGLIKTALGLVKFRKNVVSNLNENPPDCIICHDADTLAVGRKIKKRYNIPLVLDMHDLQHTWVLMPSPRSQIRKLISWRMKKSFLNRVKSVDRIVTSCGALEEGKNLGFKEWLKSHGHDSIVVENRPIVTKVLPLPDEKRWTVAHLGKIRDINSIRLLIKAVQIIPNNQRPNLLIAGDGVEENSVKRLIENFSLSEDIDYEIKGRYQKHEMESLLKQTNVMYAMYDPQRGNISQGALPVKMFDAAAHGVPSIVNANCLMGELCESEELGLSVEWNNESHLAETLVKLKNKRVRLEKTGAGGKRMYIDLIQSLLNS